jgi:hypothetical protein
MSRHVLILDRNNRGKAIVGVDKAPDGWVMELREGNKTDAQERALHGLIDQIRKQRPIMNGIRMTKEVLKATFMHGLGRESRMIPTLDGTSYFPMGLSTKNLTIAEYADLITFVLAWAAREGLTIEHFDGQEPEERQQRPPVAA